MESRWINLRPLHTRRMLELPQSCRICCRLIARRSRSLKASEKPLKKADGGGLFILVQPDGKKHWRLAYRFCGKQKLLSGGAYPAVSLAGARKCLHHFTERGILAADFRDIGDTNAIKWQGQRRRHKLILTHHAWQ